MNNYWPWLITFAAVGGLVYLLGRPETPTAPTPNPEPGNCKPKMTTCMNGITAAAPCYCDDHGGVAPAPCQGIADPAAFYRCLERNVNV